MDTDRAIAATFDRAEPRPASLTLYENLQAVAEQVGAHSEALNRLGQRLEDAEQRIQELLREVGKSAAPQV